MSIRIGEVVSIFRYPVKSMRGERIDAVDVGWHGLEGDRRLAFRRPDDRAGFPWLTASRLPELLLYTPHGRTSDGAGALPTHVRLPEGESLGLYAPELAADVSRRCGVPVEMVHLNRGIFDEASVSLITSSTIDEVSRLAGQPSDVRRFRPNILLGTSGSVPFAEDAWVGGVLTFGTASDALAVCVTNRDERCAMVNVHPDTAQVTPEVLRAVAQVRDTRAGVYATVVRRGRLAVGQPVFFEPA